MKLRRRFYISWVGLRGAAPIVFATYQLLACIENANMIFNIVFFISVTSILIQGTTLSIIAKWLNVALPEEAKNITENDRYILNLPKSEMEEITVLPGSFAVEKRIIDLHFPRSVFIVMIKRNDKFVRPGGSTVIESNDTLVLLLDNEDSLEDARNILTQPSIA